MSADGSSIEQSSESKFSEKNSADTTEPRDTRVPCVNQMSDALAKLYSDLNIRVQPGVVLEPPKRINHVRKSQWTVVSANVDEALQNRRLWRQNYREKNRESLRKRERELYHKKRNAAKLLTSSSPCGEGNAKKNEEELTNLEGIRMERRKAARQKYFEKQRMIREHVKNCSSEAQKALLRPEVPDKQKVAQKDARKQNDRKCREKCKKIIQKKNKNYGDRQVQEVALEPKIEPMEISDFDSRNNDGSDELLIKKFEGNEGGHSLRGLGKEKTIIERSKKKILERQVNGNRVPTVPKVEPMETTNSETYSNYVRDIYARNKFTENFTNNQFGHMCSVCERLWFERDLKKAAMGHEAILKKITKSENVVDMQLCKKCKLAIEKDKVPSLSVYNGFKYPVIPPNLPKLDFLNERLLSPRLPFMQLRRLHHIPGESPIYAQIINVPVSMDTIAESLPRNSANEHCIYVHLNKKKIHNISPIKGIIDISSIKKWLAHLLLTPLYQHYNIRINESFFEEEIPCITPDNIDEFSESIDIEESWIAQQETLLWSEDKFLRYTPSERNVPKSLVFDDHEEELAFPSIYVGRVRKFRYGIKPTPSMIASSELMRKDRRGVTPHHLLYMAVKMMRLRIRDCLTVAFKYAQKNTEIPKDDVESKEYRGKHMEASLSFLRSISNSIWYWAERKRDLFAMIRQMGGPTASMSLSANEIGWPDLLQLLFRLSNDTEKTEQIASELSHIDKCALIKNDAVTCAIYFNKLVDVLMKVLQSKLYTPFGKYRVSNYFKRIEFPQGASPRAHILLWLDNAPEDILGKDQEEAVELIDSLISVSEAEASGHIELQAHKHSFSCYKKKSARYDEEQMCKCHAPFMPCKTTMILTPMNKNEAKYDEYAKRYTEIRVNLESTHYSDIEEFYKANDIDSDEQYRNILEAGITKPRIFYKRHPSEKWNMPFNPFVLNIMRSNVDFQIISDEHFCAQYLMEYVNKSDRGLSNLRRKIFDVVEEHLEFDIVELTRKMSADIANSIEMTTQEAAWYLLQQPMFKTSVPIKYINTCWPYERQMIKKTIRDINSLDIDCTDIWTGDCCAEYEKRPEQFEEVSLAQFFVKYEKNPKEVYVAARPPRIIRYRNYDVEKEYDNYRREMVTLHVPFRNEEKEILDDMRFNKLFEDNEATILRRQKQLEVDLDLQETIKNCREFCQENDKIYEDDRLEISNVVTRFPEHNPFQSLYKNPDATVNKDFRIITMDNVGHPIRKESLVNQAQFGHLPIRNEHEKQQLAIMSTMSTQHDQDHDAREKLKQRNREYGRRYRERVRLRKQQGQDMTHISTFTPEDLAKYIRRKQLARERVKRYRERLKLARNKFQPDTSLSINEDYDTIGSSTTVADLREPERMLMPTTSTQRNQGLCETLLKVPEMTLEQTGQNPSQMEQPSPIVLTPLIKEELVDIEEDEPQPLTGESKEVGKSDEQLQRADSDVGLWRWLQGLNNQPVENLIVNRTSCDDEILGI